MTVGNISVSNKGFAVLSGDGTTHRITPAVLRKYADREVRSIHLSGGLLIVEMCKEKKQERMEESKWL